MRHDALNCLGPHGFHRVHYVEWGEHDNPRVVICVHGLTRNGRDFDTLARRLESHYRVICPDVVGRGQSDWLEYPEDYGYPLYLSDMSALIARCAVQSVDWVGTSMGGLIGAMLAAQRGTPIRRLIVNDVGPFVPKAALMRIAAYVGSDPRFPDLHAVDRYLRTVFAPFGRLTDEQWAHLAVHSARKISDTEYGLAYDPRIAHAFKQVTSDIDLWPLWKTIGIPILVTRGKESDLLLSDTAQKMIETAPNGSRLVEFEGIGHAPTFMSDDQIAVVEAFLES